MNKKIIDFISETKSKYEGACSEAMNKAEISALEKEIGTFPNDFKQFLQITGGGIINGIEIFGGNIADFSAYGETIVDVTVRKREDVTKEYQKMIIFSLDGSGNPVGFLPNKSEIFTIDHDYGGWYHIATNFEEYINKVVEGTL